MVDGDDTAWVEGYGTGLKVSVKIHIENIFVLSNGPFLTCSKDTTTVMIKTYLLITLLTTLINTYIHVFSLLF